MSRRPADTVLVAVADLVSQLHELQRRNDELDRRNAELVTQLAEVEDSVRQFQSAPGRELRDACRRGYFTGYTAGKEGRAPRDDPENAARGNLRLAMDAAS